MTEALAAPQIEFHSVSKRYANTAMILEGIDLTILKGEFVSLIGPSGCGKSTVLKLISGLTAPTSGAITVDGMTPRNARETVSYIFQDATLLPWRPVQQNVGLGLELEGAGKAIRQEKTASLLKLVGLEHVAKAYPRELSGGMKMRVSIARALAARPKLLLMDEPFAALDEITRAGLNDDLLALAREDNITVIFVTHSVMESAYLSTRVLVMSPRPGRITADIALSPGPHDRLSEEFAAAQRRVASALLEAA
ncbi:MAG: ABC transporter ATP-binding protein [Candidatus Acidiferrales bacterium]